MFNERLKELIFEKCNNSQKEFSVITGIPTSTISHWLTRNIKPTYVQIVKICDIFQISADYLLGRENYATGNIEIIGEKLDEDEKKLLGVYRALDKAGKQSFLSVAENLATLHNVTLKSKLS